VYPAERHKWLIDTARETGRVSVAEASTALGVVPETIRRDLDQLCNQKMLRRGQQWQQGLPQLRQPDAMFPSPFTLLAK